MKRKLISIIILTSIIFQTLGLTKVDVAAAANLDVQVQGTVQSTNLRTIMVVDTPVDKSVQNGTLSINGWALDSIGIKQVEIYLNNELIGATKTGLGRPDVDAVFPGYPNGKKGGFSCEIDISKFSQGEYNLKVRAIGESGGVFEENKTINIKKLPPLINTDFPLNNSTVKQGSFTIEGWSLNTSGVKLVRFYINDKLEGEIAPNVDRPDVITVFTDYNRVNTMIGYSYTVSTEKLIEGSNKITVEAIGNDGATVKEYKNINKTSSALVNAVNIDTPTNNSRVTEGNFILKGWTLQSSGIERINVYSNGRLVISTKSNQARPDVVLVFPGYPDGENNGYEFSIDASNLSAGNNELIVESIGKNGNVARERVMIQYSTPNSNLIMGTNIDSPVENYNAASGVFNFDGWVLHPVGIASINLYVNNNIVWSGKPNVLRPDVVGVFPGYPDGRSTGYSFRVTPDMLRAGSNILKVEVVGKDGTRKSEERRINYGILKSEMNLDAPTKYFYTDKDNSLTVQGWALHNSKIQNVQVIIDDKVVYTGVLNQERSDVKAEYPMYTDGLMSGFYYTIPLGNVNSGTHNLKVNAISDTGEVITRSTKFYKANSKLIVIDPGHGGSDPGAIGVHGGISHKESYYNLMLSLKIKEKLEAYGFSVIMTRNSEGETVELQDRSVIANNLGPIFFLSIHHDAFNTRAKGSSTHYSTYRPNIDSSGLYVQEGVIFDSTPSVPAAQSEMIAKSLATVISSVGFDNRGYKDHNLSVTRNTNMPSVLAECGFIDSATDIRIISDPLRRDMLAQKIAATIHNHYGN